MSKNSKVSAVRHFLERIAAGVALILLWDFAVRFGGVSKFVLPAPMDVAESFYMGVKTGVFFDHGVYTMASTLIGFFIGSLFGFVIGVLISQVPMLDRIIYPYVIAFQTIPKVAIAPLVVIWFGFGLGSKIAISAMICFFPVVVNTIEGLKSTKPEQIMLLRSYKASRYQIFTRVQLPNALPFVFAGLDIGIVLSVIGTIVGEFIGSSAGLGYLLMQFNHTIDVAGVFATLIVLSLLGIVLNIILRRIHMKVVFWRRPTEIKT
jgi:NitT/TauT family transport system permease protein